MCEFVDTVEKWGVFELSCAGKQDGNPFTDYDITACFESRSEKKTVSGFYDGNGVYKVRFMPSFEEEYVFTVSGSFSEEVCRGRFTATAPKTGNHGPVSVSNRYHFSYADGAPYCCVGTTCYVWHLQSDERIRQTLETLGQSPFNKIRFCVFPKHYDYNLGEPPCYPYERAEDGSCWDFARFRPEYFRRVEACVAELMRMGIEADLILFHPYDRWGFSQMSPEQDAFYLRYAAARFSAFRNVWWALANEYDLMPQKRAEDWERVAEVIMESDPYGHLRSVHNCMRFYDHAKPWITHCSIQRQDLYKSAELVTEWRGRWQKPVVLDEMGYEGDIQHGWGNLTAEELVRRFWEAACRGGYGGHGETYLCEENVLWWSHGGILRGQSRKRIAFLREIMEQAPAGGLAPKPYSWDEICAVPENEELALKTGYRLFYYSFMRPSFREYCFDDGEEYSVDVIDTWNMTIENVGKFKGKFLVPLPAKQYIAVRIMKAKTA